MSWKDDLYKLDIQETEDLDALSESATEAKTEDVGMINTTSGVGILARENGTLEGFADYGLGFRFNRDSQSLLVFAPNIHLFAMNIEKHDVSMKSTFLKDEYKDIESLLQDAKRQEGETQ